jgi:heterodisulfide reductase subunit D
VETNAKESMYAPGVSFRSVGAGFQAARKALNIRAAISDATHSGSTVMDSSGFESALEGRIDEMLGACTTCGACFTACPIAGPAGLGEADPKTVVAGVLDIVRLGSGPAESEKWAKACMLSGECIKACDYGVNPRFLLAMARLAMTRKAEPRERRKAGVQNFRRMSEDVGVLSHLQLSDDALERLGQKPTAGPPADDGELPDVVFYTGCNVLKTPHIALLCLDIMDAIGTRYKVMGGPSHCCGVIQLRTGDTETSSRLPATPWTSSRSPGPARCWPGARAASCNLPRPCCRPSNARPARFHST